MNQDTVSPYGLFHPLRPLTDQVGQLWKIQSLARSLPRLLNGSLRQSEFRAKHFKFRRGLISVGEAQSLYGTSLMVYGLEDALGY